MTNNKEIDINSMSSGSLKNKVNNKFSEFLQKNNVSKMVNTTSIYDKNYLEKLLVIKNAAEINYPILMGRNDFVKNFLVCTNDKDNSEGLYSGANISEDNFNSVLVSSINYVPKVVKMSDTIPLLNIKINLREKIEYFKNEYIKTFAMSTSHNFIVSKIAKLKLGFYVMILSALGVTSDEMSLLKKRCLQDLFNQNKKAFEENEYASELLEIIGARKKQLKKERKVLATIRKQLIKQMENLGFKNYYTSEKINEICFYQCKKILTKLLEERNNLTYQKEFNEICLYPQNEIQEINEKIFRNSTYIKRAKDRLQKYSAAIDVDGELKEVLKNGYF